MKKIVVFLIDSFMPEALQQGLEQQKLPVFNYLITQGAINMKCFSIFPTMSASFDASFITGVNPGVHKIPGLVWYDKKENRMINYGATFFSVLKLGIKQVAQDILYNQNNHHLSTQVKTTYEELETLGYSSGAFNYQLFRGNYQHKVSPPWFFNLITRGALQSSIHGPNEIILGNFVNSLGKTIHAPKSLLNRFGINDDYSIQSFIEMIKNKKQPDFSLVYLPSTDQYVHKKYLSGGIESLIKLDSLLKKVLTTYGSFEEALKNNIFILTGDHSQAKITDLIPLNQLLNKFNYPKLRDKISPNHEIIICNNERMVYIYYRNESTAQKVIEELTKDSRIDIIAVKNDDWIRVVSGEKKGELFFKKGVKFIDEYAQAWDLKGEEKILDLSLTNNKIHYKNYPDALAMLESALNSTNMGTIIATAKPGYMFKSENSPNYKGGGSHGGLHISEMQVPFIVSEKTSLPLPIKLTQTKNFIINLFKENLAYNKPKAPV